MESHHDHGNSYKGKHLTGTDLQAQRFSPLLSWQEAWCHAGRHSAGEVAESSSSVLAGSRRMTLGQPGLIFLDLTAYPHSDTLPPARLHTYYLLQACTSY